MKTKGLNSMTNDAGSGALTTEYLTEMVGTDAARKLLAYYNGKTVYLPKSRKLKQVRQWNEILRLRANGASYSAIARKLNVSTRAAQAIVARGKTYDPANYALFMPASFCKLAEQIGMEAAESLCDALGGFEWTFPNINSMDEV